MKLFVSWSGEYSRQIAAALKRWIPAVIQSVEVFYSPEDIEKGDDWNSRLNQELEECKYGIVCLTPENVKAPWINFEAGALAKTMDSRVSALMLGIETSDVKGPLSRFQNTRFEKEDFKKLVRSINRATDKSLDPGVLDYIFDNMWPHLRTSLADIEEQLKKHFSDDTVVTGPERKEHDALQEMLYILRKMDSKDNSHNKYGTTYQVHNSDRRKIIFTVTDLGPDPSLVIDALSQEFDASKKMITDFFDRDGILTITLHDFDSQKWKHYEDFASQLGKMGAVTLMSISI